MRMKNKIWLPVVGVLCAVALGRANTLDDAQQAFIKGDYQHAVSLYEQAAEASAPSAGIYYNLGESQLKAGATADAALSFRRALVLNPELARARIALTAANQTLGVREGPVTWLQRIVSVVSPDTLVLAGSAVAWLGGFLFLIAIFRKRASAGSVGLSAFAAIFGGAVLLVGIVADPRIEDRNQAIVTAADGATALVEPVDHSDAVAQLPAGTPVWVLSERGRWSYCELAGGARGWLVSSNTSAVIPKT